MESLLDRDMAATSGGFVYVVMEDVERGSGLIAEKKKREEEEEEEEEVPLLARWGRGSR